MLVNPPESFTTALTTPLVGVMVAVALVPPLAVC
ncbi:MAG: DUF389 domain-containing protein, partial [Planctomycetes bacterium]|nr:DUF389 domain-containing protein [Planctomycetota bacterium]